MTTHAVYMERLLRLAAGLEKDARNKKGMQFDLDVLINSESDDPAPACGTVGCAMGLAALSGLFSKEGLTIGDNRPFYNVVIRRNGRLISDNYSTAAQRLFGITRGDVMHLFTTAGYGGVPTTGRCGELAVARQIRDFVKQEVRDHGARDNLYLRRLWPKNRSAVRPPIFDDAL